MSKFIDKSERTRNLLLSLFKQDSPQFKDEIDPLNMTRDTSFANKYGYETAFKATQTFTVKGWGLDLDSYFLHVLKNGKWGICSRDGKEIIPCEHEDIDYVYQCMGYTIVLAKKDGKWGGYWLYPELPNLPFEYDNLWWDQTSFVDKICAIKDGKECLLDYKQSYIIEPIYNKLSQLNYPCTLLKAYKGETWVAILTPDGKVVIPEGKYDSIRKENNQVLGLKDGVEEEIKIDI